MATRGVWPFTTAHGAREALWDSALFLGAYEAKIFERLKKETCQNVTFSWINGVILPFTTTVTGGGWTSSTTTTIKCADTTIFVVGDIGRFGNTAGSELCRITAVSATNLTVTRKYKSTSAKTTASNAKVIRLGVGLISGAGPASTIGTARNTSTSYTETVETVCAVAGDAGSDNTVEGDFAAARLTEDMKNHIRAIGHKLYWSKDGIGTSAIPTTLRGIIGGNGISTHKYSVSSNTITRTRLAKYIATVTQATGETPDTIFCNALGYSYLGALNLIDVDTVITSGSIPNLITAGIQDKKLVADFGGIMEVVYDPVFDSGSSSTGELVFVNTKRAILQVKRKTFSKTFDDGTDTLKTKIITELGLQIGHEKFHIYARGITAAS